MTTKLIDYTTLEKGLFDGASIKIHVEIDGRRATVNYGASLAVIEDHTATAFIVNNLCDEITPSDICNDEYSQWDDEYLTRLK
jgi:hypothetical protein